MLWFKRSSQTGAHMFCNHCGSSNPDDARFCSKCGHRTNSPPAAPIEPTTSVPFPSKADVTPASSVTADSITSDVAVPASEPSKTCPVCHLINNGSTATCGCGFDFISGTVRSRAHQAHTPVGTTSSVPHPFTIYATLSQRLAAYITDYILIYLIVVAVYFFAALFGTPIPESEGPAQGISILALFAYMTIAQATYHTTVGKYVMGLEVGSSMPSRSYPSFMQILRRETIGRFGSLLFFGIGYWRVNRHPQKQAWSDKIAKTVVRVRTTNPTIKKALTAFVWVALVAVVAVTTWGYHLKDKQERYDALVKNLGEASTEVGNLRESINELLQRDPQDFEELQGNMQELIGTADRCFRAIDRVQSLYRRAQIENLYASDAERVQAEVAQQAYELRKQQVAKQREEATLIFQYDPTTSDWDALQSRLRLLDSDIAGLEHQASQKLATIGIK